MSSSFPVSQQALITWLCWLSTYLTRSSVKSRGSGLQECKRSGKSVIFPLGALITDRFSLSFFWVSHGFNGSRPFSLLLWLLFTYFFSKIYYFIANISLEALPSWLAKGASILETALWPEMSVRHLPETEPSLQLCWKPSRSQPPRHPLLPLISSWRKLFLSHSVLK